MNKEELNQKLSDLEAEASKLRSLINEPEVRTPEAGDVWAWDVGGGRPIWLVAENNQWVTIDGLSGRNNITDMTGNGSTEHSYLGKFSEVYVRRDGHVSISDVRDALSIEDGEGDSVLSSGKHELIYVLKGASTATREALAKLGITAK